MRSATSRKASPSSTARSCRRRAATSLADALRNVPGITIGAAEGGSIGNNFNLRGFSARTDLYLDGMRDRGTVLPRRLLARLGRGAAGTIVHAVRPRLDRRRHQPGQQAADARAVRERRAHRRHAAVRARNASTRTSRSTTPRRFAWRPWRRTCNSTRDVMKNQDYGHRAVAQVRHRASRRRSRSTRSSCTTTTCRTTACRPSTERRRTSTARTSTGRRTTARSRRS